jgi:hemerythrin-like domain-containing protein
LNLNAVQPGKPMLLAHDHSELDELLAEFFSVLAAGNIAQSFERLDLFWARLAMHIRAEHLHLFPTLLHAVESSGEAKEAASRAPSLEIARDIIARLRKDHDFFMSELTAAIKQLRQLRENPHQDKPSLVQNVREKIVAVSERLKVHNELEESHVYPWANMLLTPAARVALNQKMQKELANLPARFN